MTLSLPTHQLQAFAAVARLGSASRAAEELHVTQSALSQRILNLEETLGAALFIRDPKGLRLTASGERLLRYSRQKEIIDQEIVSEFTGDPQALTGTLRLGAFSSVLRSRALPALAPLLEKHPGIRLELFTREMRELLPMLKRNEVDLILTLAPSDGAELESRKVGEEENVLARPRRKHFRADVFLDHDPSDSTTLDFWRLQSKKPEAYRREFFDEVYALQDGVALGLGQAILPRHLVEEDKRLQIVTGLKPLRLPIYLVFYRQAFYSRLLTSAKEALSRL